MHDSSTSSSAAQTEKNNSSEQDQSSTHHVDEKKSPQTASELEVASTNATIQTPPEPNISSPSTTTSNNQDTAPKTDSPSNNKVLLEENLIDQKKKLEEENKSLQEQVKTLKDKVLRVQADYINYRRRMEEDLNKRLELGKFDIITKLIDNYDQLVLINNNWKNAENEDQAVVKKFLTRFQAQFEEIGIKKIPTLGEKVDLRYHEVVQSPQDISHDELIIISEIKSGYTFGSRVIRPALVALGKSDKIKTLKKDTEEVKN